MVRIFRRCLGTIWGQVLGDILIDLLMGLLPLLNGPFSDLAMKPKMMTHTFLFWN